MRYAADVVLKLYVRRSVLRRSTRIGLVVVAVPDVWERGLGVVVVLGGVGLLSGLGLFV